MSAKKRAARVSTPHIRAIGWAIVTRDLQPIANSVHRTRGEAIDWYTGGAAALQTWAFCRRRDGVKCLPVCIVGRFWFDKDGAR